MHTRWCLPLAGIAGVLLLAPFGAGAQQTSGRGAAADSVFRRAVELVNDGEGAAGRALLDSMVSAAPEGSPALAEALYWRATVAPSAAEAERDYKRVILEHSLSARVPDALLRLAQLELARGDRENAVRRLQRLDIEYPAYPGRPRAGYWLARAYLDQNDLQRGCAAVVEARARTSQTDVELRNQIDFLALRCPVAQPPAVTEAGGAGAPTAAAPPPPQAGSQAVAERPQNAGPPPATERPDNVERPRTSPGQSAAAPQPAPSTTPPPPPAATAGDAWSVQVAAFNTRPQANALAERLRTRGYQARVDGSAAPFRVRIGRYPTRAAAAAALQELKGRGIDGFVTDVGTR